MSYDFRNSYAADHARIPRRRWTPWVLGLSMLLAVAGAIWETMRSAPGDGSLPNWFAFWLPLLTACASPFARDTWLTERGTASYDEFERAALARATSRAYLVLLLATAAFAGWCALASLNRWPLPNSVRDWVAWAMALLGCGVCLPIFLAELMVPFPPAEDGEDEL